MIEILPYSQITKQKSYPDFYYYFHSRWVFFICILSLNFTTYNNEDVGEKKEYVGYMCHSSNKDITGCLLCGHIKINTSNRGKNLSVILS